jgi:hypothetical protein
MVAARGIAVETPGRDARERGDVLLPGEEQLAELVGRVSRFFQYAQERAEIGVGASTRVERVGAQAPLAGEREPAGGDDEECSGNRGGEHGGREGPAA